MHYIWQNKAVNFLRISFKVRRLIIALALAILYCFETAYYLIIFFVFDILEVSNLLINFSKT